MLRAFEKKLTEYSLLKKGEGIVVAVSGGVDSMVLMDLLRRLQATWHFDLTIAHVNFGLRGKASNADEELVRNEAIRSKFPFKVARWKRPQRVNLQDAARQFRYDFFRQVADKTQASYIATAHNRDDQAETVLMHLIRGSGVKGLLGMSPIAGENPKIIRPLLFFSRCQIEEYAKKKKVSFAEDKTNRKLIYKRNLIRHNVLPMLEKLNPCVKESLADVAMFLRDYDEAIDVVAYEYVQEFFRAGKNTVTWNRSHFIELPNAIRRRVLVMAYEGICGNRANLNSDQIEHMDKLSTGKKHTSRYMLPGHLQFSRLSDLLSIRKSY